jgi:hypothetical protein
MSITAIARDWGVNPAIVRITSTNTLSQVGTSGYLTAQASNIEAINNGSFEWLASDMVLVVASDGWGFFTISSDFASLDAFVFVPGVTLPTVVGNLAMFDSIGGNLADSGIAAADVMTSALADGHIFVGSAGGVATDVAMSGDATIVASGALTIANNAITTAKILNANVTLAKLAAGITPSHVIKFANQVTTVGGAAAEAFTVTGAVGATDRAFVQVVDNGTGNVTALQAVVTDDTLTVTFSADPQNDTIINYQIIRVAS